MKWNYLGGASAACLAVSALTAFGNAQARDLTNSIKEKVLPPFTIQTLGSFAYGGTVITGDNGDTFHGDHGNAHYIIPKKPRALPIVMWHGGGQFKKTWESTPDGREGYESLMVRNGYGVYLVDQPRRGSAGRSTIGANIPNGTPGEATSFNTFRLGIWTPPSQPQFFSNVAFPKDPASIDQYWRQITVNVGPESRDFQQAGGVALMDKVGPAILMTHSNSGQYGWRVAMQSSNVKAVVAYEPAGWSFPQSAPPADVPTTNAQVQALTAPDLVSDADFAKLTKIPIQIIYGDNIEFNTPSPIFGVELWRVVTQRAKQFVAEINKRGGHAEVLFLPDAGLKGNTHFPFSDLNNRQVADLLVKWLHKNKLDVYPSKRSASN